MAFNLVQESHRFKDNLTNLLNATICDGIRLSCIVFESDGYTVLGYEISRYDVRGEALPIKLNRDPTFFLGLSINLRPDPQREHLMVFSSAMILGTGPVITNANMLLHYDYERDKSDGYPEAHLQICATSPAWEEAAIRPNCDARPLSKRHLPVGGRRFRPTLEDIIEFLVVEQFADARPGWKEALDSSRDEFREKQLRAAIRRYPNVALAQLKADGHLV